MNLVRKLNSVGKRAFIENFGVFQNYAKGLITRDDAIDHLVELGVSNRAGAAIRVGNAKLIFKNHRTREALDIVLGSKRMSGKTIVEAKRILNELD